MSAVIETRSGPSTAAIVPSRPLASGDGARAIAFDAGGELSLDTFFSPVRGLAQLLPDASHAINLFEDRYRFLVAFCAVALRGQTTLLPPSRPPAAYAQVRAHPPHTHR